MVDVTSNQSVGGGTDVLLLDREGRIATDDPFIDPGRRAVGGPGPRLGGTPVPRRRPPATTRLLLDLAAESPLSLHEPIRQSRDARQRSLRVRMFATVPAMDFAFGSLLTVAESVPWIPLGPGESFKPLRFLAGNRGRVLLLRLEPGCTVAPHRHTGDVHAFNVDGFRELIDSGQIVGPGDYVYEPAGNADTWRVVGEGPCTVFITTRGVMEYLDEMGEVIQSDTTETMRDTYHRYCSAKGLDVVNLDG
jgi:2,4'-dihydroxyacetophenone dioxygenase